MILPEHIREVFAKASCLYSKAEVESALDRMADEINDQLENSNPIFLCVVVGGIIPLGNLLPRLNFPLEVDYVHATRYGDRTKGGSLRWKVEPETALVNRTVVIVDDILDGGITLKSIVDFCHQQNAKEVLTAVLVDKHEARLPEGIQKADFCGLKAENHFLFGYGMDYKGYLRNAPGIYVIAPEFE